MFDIKVVKKNYFGIFLKRGHWKIPGMTYLADENRVVWHGWRSMPKITRLGYANGKSWQNEWRGRHMYYVLQVAPGEEDKTEALIMAILPNGLYGECFHLTRHMQKKFHGKWVDVHEKLLPGYVFITTENAKGLFLELKKVPMLTNIVGRDGWSFVEMAEGDVEWLEKIKGYSVQVILDKDKADNKDIPWYEVGLSQVSVDEGNQIKIVSGPLKGIEGMVKKLHLHKRVAEVEIPFMKRKTVIYLGVDLLQKEYV